MIPRFQLYLFDIDGTLLESAGDICGAVRAALAERGIGGLTEAYLRSFIGHHLFDLFREVLPGSSPAEHEQLLARYREIYLARGHRSTRIYPGVVETLAALGGLKSTATTKSTETARNVLAQFGLISWFDGVQGTDGFPSKPAPDVIEKSLEKFGVPRAQCLLIGDAGPDMEAGRRAGVRTCAAAWGYGDHEAMRRLQPDFWISSPAELLS